jgi:UDP-N-acetylglucosamine 4,6-dehydratase
MKKEFPNCNYILGDVSRYNDLELAFRGIDIIFHLAAYKQVPSAQNNANATIETNIIGSRNVAKAAILSGVKQVVASSTDKACSPVNLYGTSKSAMETIFQDANKYKETTFHLSRYGNVICSSASVVPLFQKQAENDGPLTVTHREMTRFWITLDTAVDLVIHALGTEPGIVVVPEAKSLEIIEVAKAIGGDLEIKEIGIREGEKLHESMVAEAESFHTEKRKVRDVEGIENVYYIHPPVEQFRNRTAPFDYNSLDAERLTVEEFLGMVDG